MEKAKIPVVKRTLFSWVFSGNSGLQILLLAVIPVMIYNIRSSEEARR